MKGPIDYALYLHYYARSSDRWDKELPLEFYSPLKLQCIDTARIQGIILTSKIGEYILLTQLYMSYSCLKSLPTEIGKLVNLECLSLTGNPLMRLPMSMNKLTKLTDLNLRLDDDSNVPRGLRGDSRKQYVKSHLNDINHYYGNIVKDSIYYFLTITKFVDKFYLVNDIRKIIAKIIFNTNNDECWDDLRSKSQLFKNTRSCNTHPLKEDEIKVSDDESDWPFDD